MVFAVLIQKFFKVQIEDLVLDKICHSWPETTASIFESIISPLSLSVFNLNKWSYDSTGHILSSKLSFFLYWISFQLVQEEGNQSKTAWIVKISKIELISLDQTQTVKPKHRILRRTRDNHQCNHFFSKQNKVIMQMKQQQTKCKHFCPNCDPYPSSSLKKESTNN